MAEPRPGELATCLQNFGLARDRMRALLAGGAGISTTDLDALEHLEADGPLTQRELGDRLAITSGAVTMLVDRLEGAGWVRRRPHPTDRRYLLVELTAQALEQAPPALAVYHDNVRALAAKVPASERKAVREFLQGAAALATKAAAELGPRPLSRRLSEAHVGTQGEDRA